MLTEKTKWRQSKTRRNPHRRILKDSDPDMPTHEFSLKPGEITGKYEEQTHQRYRKRQYGFTQNIAIQEISGQIIGSMDQVPEGQKYTLRQLILRLKNNDTRTSHLYPQLFYDVVKVGESGTTRFIFLTCLEKEAIEAAKNILAVLIRNFGNKKGIKDLFTFEAQDDAASNPFSNTEMRTQVNALAIMVYLKFYAPCVKQKMMRLAMSYQVVTWNMMKNLKTKKI